MPEVTVIKLIYKLIDTNNYWIRSSKVNYKFKGLPKNDAISLRNF